MFKTGDRVVINKKKVKEFKTNYSVRQMVGKVWTIYKTNGKTVYIKDCPTGVDAWDANWFEHYSKLSKVLE